MRSSKAAATSDCLPLREWPVMLTRDASSGGSCGSGGGDASSTSSTRDATKARPRILRKLALAYAARKASLASRVSAPGYTTPTKPRRTAAIAQLRWFHCVRKRGSFVFVAGGCHAINTSKATSVPLARKARRAYIEVSDGVVDEFMTEAFRMDGISVGRKPRMCCCTSVLSSARRAGQFAAVVWGRRMGGSVAVGVKEAPRAARSALITWARSQLVVLFTPPSSSRRCSCSSPRRSSPARACRSQ